MYLTRRPSFSARCSEKGYSGRLTLECEGLSFDENAGPIKFAPGGSSTVDLAVYAERAAGRRGIYGLYAIRRLPARIFPPMRDIYLQASGAASGKTPLKGSAP